eukprot:TRINITY_DN1238_c1_g1_i1.p1 TRINITY_DN1238_c1_g1~~TRINITY_DN1238_c1_g1_i1.p1  ORF type:complete len:208 (+),score=90.80 TRINITY_DN1238_c1_g1_i1:59-682(+)
MESNQSQFNVEQANLLINLITKNDLNLTKLDFRVLLTQIGQSQNNPLLTNQIIQDFLFSLFDSDHNGAVELKEFVVGLSVISNGSLDEKATLAFKAYDKNNDATLSRNELFALLRNAHNTCTKIFKKDLKKDLNGSQLLGINPSLFNKANQDNFNSIDTNSIIEQTFRYSTDSTLNLNQFKTAVANIPALQNLLDPINFFKINDNHL